MKTTSFYNKLNSLKIKLYKLAFFLNDNECTTSVWVSQEIVLSCSNLTDLVKWWKLAEWDTERAKYSSTPRGRRGKRSGAGEEWKKCCPCMKPAESPLFFQLQGAANSAHSKLAYDNKANWEIMVETTGIFNPSSSSPFLLSSSQKMANHQ